MTISVVFLLAIASGFTSYTSAASKFTWIDLSVDEPPPLLSTSDNENITYIHDKEGNLKKVAIDKASNESTPYFSVETDVIFELYTRKNPTEPQFLSLNNYTTVRESNFNWRLPTRILIHGWYSEGLLTPRFADAYLVNGRHRVNFIAVNWQKGSDTVNYLAARRRVRDVARHVAEFIDFMTETAGLRMNFLTVIGHSLGAHVSGIAGKMIKKGKINKIVGLDPASPFFKYNDVTDRLADTDALYVEVIHTCAGTLGFSQPIGHASFFPNGGRAQPGCGWDMSGACAHGRAYEFYLESINKQQFFAFECESLASLQKGNCSVVNGLVRMGGEPGNKMRKGIYFLKTNDKPAFSKGQVGIVQAIIQAEAKTSKFAYFSYAYMSSFFTWKANKTHVIMQE